MQMPYEKEKRYIIRGWICVEMFDAVIYFSFRLNWQKGSNIDFFVSLQANLFIFLQIFKLEKAVCVADK